MNRPSLVFPAAAVLTASLAAGTDARAQGPADTASTAFGASTATTTARPVDIGRLEAFVDGVVAAYQREHLLPGVVVGVVVDGSPAFAKGYGYADLDRARPVDPERTLFRVGSVSKTFVWTAVMMLVERGSLDLDADLRDALEGVELPFEGEAPVTLEQIMGHRAGFEDTLGIFTWTDDGATSLAEALGKDRPARVLEPGTRTSYSNWASALAALVVERAAGVPFATFVEREITGPLAMHSTTLLGPSQMPESLRSRLAIGYRERAGYPAPQAYAQLGPHAPAGAVATTAADMIRWMRFHLNGGELEGVRLMAEATHRAMWTRPFPDRPTAPDLAHGFFDRTLSGARVLGHGGGLPSFLTDLQMVPARGLGVFVSQCSAHDASLVRHLVPAVVAYLEGAAWVHPVGEVGSEPNPARWAAYVGTYLANRRPFTRFETLLSALQIAQVVPAERGGTITVVLGGEPVRAAPVDGEPDVFEDALGRRIAFGRNQDGEVTHFTDPMGVHSYEKVGFLGNPQLLAISAAAALLASLLLWLLAFRRVGRPTGHTWRGAAVRWLALACTLPLFGLIGLGVAITVVYADAGFAELMADYPPPLLVAVRTVLRVQFGAGVVALASVIPAWRGAGFGWPIRIIHTLWGLAMAALALTLLSWNAVFGAFS